MTNAAAPMIGGAICPPVEATASTAAANAARVAEAHHHRNGEVARRRDIGHRRARDHAEEAAGDGGDLGRPARLAPAKTHCQVHEGLAATRMQQQRAEENEGRNHRRRHPGEHAPDAQIAQKHRLGHEFDVEAAMAERARETAAKQRIGKAERHQDREDQPDRPPPQFKHCDQKAELSARCRWSWPKAASP